MKMVKKYDPIPTFLELTKNDGYRPNRESEIRKIACYTRGTMTRCKREFKLNKSGFDKLFGRKRV